MIKKGIIVLIAFVLIQLIRPKKNESKDTTDHISNEFDVPVAIAEILQTSCYDCHSNYTNEVWYDKVAPVSWIVSNHINSGKEHVNFSEWMGYNAHQKKFIIAKLIQSVARNTMPTKGYVMLHKQAALSKEQQELLKEWFQTLKK